MEAESAIPTVIQDTPDIGTLLSVHAFDWTVKDMSGDDDHVAIHCWALDRNSKPHLIRYTDFPAFCQIELPLFVRNHTYRWNNAAVSIFMSMLSERLGDDAPLRYFFKMSKKLYYYRGNRTFPIIQLSFGNLKAMQHCTNLLNNPIKTDDWGFIKCNVWETSISVIRKLLTVRNVKYSQWFSVIGHQVEPELRISTLEREYIGQWDTMNAIPLTECMGWTTKPGVLAFDIECYSNNHRAMPDKYNSIHVAYMISCIYQRHRTPDSKLRYGVIIGDCNHIPPEKLDNCTIIRVNSEYEMVEAFGQIVRDTDPDILTGYNILAFDYPYLDHRVKRWLKQWPKMSRISGEIPIMTSKTWKSGAYGHQSINMLQLEGRISIDLCPLIRRDYKLDKYDLGSVCRKFIGKSKHDIKPVEMFLIYEDQRKALTILVDIAKEAHIDPSLLSDPTYVNRRVRAQLIYDDSKAETTRVLEYCIQDSELVIELMEKLNIWVGLVEMSSIVGTTIVDLFTRGQQVRCVSQIYDMAARLGYVLDVRDVQGFKFAGGFVYEPIPGLYDNIICLDFASLYPSIIMAYNICYTTLVPPELEDTIPDADCHIIDVEQDEIEGDTEDKDEEEILKELAPKTKKGKLVKRFYRFKFYKLQEGLLPRLVRELVAQRRAVNREIMKQKDELKALEKLEDLTAALEKYINGKIIINTVKNAAQYVKTLSGTNPPALPEIITAAKLDLLVAQLFDLPFIQKRYDDIVGAKPAANTSLIGYANVELDIAKMGVISDNMTLIRLKHGELQNGQKDRLSKIEDIKTLIVGLDKRQLSIKVTSNSFFGFLGVHTGGKMPLIEAAMSITAKGRELVTVVRKYIEEKYQGEMVYGDTDSCLGHTPILVRYRTGIIDYIQIKDLVPKNGERKEGKEYSDMSEDKIEVWTDKGWSQIRYVMRHMTKKRIYRVVTNTGVVDVTEDHSLLNQMGEEITPNQINVGMRLLHNNLPKDESDNEKIDKDKAWVWGVFMGVGECGVYTTDKGDVNKWWISSNDVGVMKRAVGIMLRMEDKYGFDNRRSKLVGIEKEEGLDGLVERYRSIFYADGYKKVPWQILMGSENIKREFLKGCYEGGKDKDISFNIKGQIGAAGLYNILTSVGINTKITIGREEMYNVKVLKGEKKKDSDKIIEIIDKGEVEEDVYDIETENHHFGAGIGRIIIHNSVMMKLPQIKDAKDCNYWGNRLAQEISGIKVGEKDCDGVIWEEGRPGLFPAPLGMEFEKAMRLLCLKKKKYAAYFIGKDGTFKTEDITDKQGNVVGNRLMMLKKGIVLARRDNCIFLRITYTKILDLIMNRGSLDEAINILVDAIQSLLDGKVSYEDLTVIRELGSNYKSNSFFMKVFSDYLKKTGKIVLPGDRLDFVIIKDETATLLGHKMRLTEQYVEKIGRENEEKIDYNYYIEKVLMNPINQLFAVGFKDEIDKLRCISYKPTNRHKEIHMDKPVQIILKMMERGYSLKTFKEAVQYNVRQLKEKSEKIVKSISLRVIKDVVVKDVVEKDVIQVSTQIPKTPKTPTLIMPRMGVRVIEVVKVVKQEEKNNAKKITLKIGI